MSTPYQIIIGSQLMPFRDEGVAKAPILAGYIVSRTGILISGKCEYAAVVGPDVTVATAIALELEWGNIDYEFQDGDDLNVFYARKGQEFWARLAPDQIIEPGNFLSISNTPGMLHKYNTEGTPSGKPGIIVAVACQELVTDDTPGLLKVSAF